MSRFIDRLWFRRFKKIPHFRTPQVLELPCNQRILLCAPHSDDEWIGCGGTLAKLKANSCVIRVVVLTDGAQGDPEHVFAGDIREMRRNETREVMTSLGIEDVCFLGYPDGSLGAHVAEARGSIARLYDEFQPDWVLTTSPGELHGDHISTAYLIFRHWLARGAKARLLAYEIYGAIRLDYLVDITDMLELKRQLIRRYQVPLRYLDYEGACEALARYRGLLIGGPRKPAYAEGFMEISKADVYQYAIGWRFWIHG